MLPLLSKVQSRQSLHKNTSHQPNCYSSRASIRKGDTELQEDQYKPSFTDFTNTLYGEPGHLISPNPYNFEVKQNSRTITKGLFQKTEGKGHTRNCFRPESLENMMTLSTVQNPMKNNYERQSQKLKAKFSSSPMKTKRSQPHYSVEPGQLISIPPYLAFAPFNSIQASTYATQRRIYSPPSSSQSRREKVTIPQIPNNKAKGLLGAQSSLKPFRQEKKYFYKFLNSQVKLVRLTFAANGFHETQNSNEFSILWTGSILRSQVYNQLSRYQKVNHFPRSYEITRKDCLCQRITRMQTVYGIRNFPFLPKTFILPSDMKELSEEMNKHKNQLWIVKPAASSQGKGIFLTNNIQTIPSKQSMIASHYINNPLLIDGVKFDIRIYVAVTCINPLRIYIYKQGLGRFATVKYEPTETDPRTAGQQRNSRFMHLTNYSINKNSVNFIKNTDADKDDIGQKWSLRALRKKLRDQGIDDDALWAKIEDIVIKTIISAEPLLNNGMDLYVPYRNNCFELLGFDILIDDNLNPWLLEVNMSPSMNIDSPLDAKIKGEMLANLFTLVGLVPNELRNDKPNTSTSLGVPKGRAGKLAVYTAGNSRVIGSGNFDPVSWGLIKKNFMREKRRGFQSDEHFGDFDLSWSIKKNGLSTSNGMSRDERQAIKDTEEEFKRQGGFTRIFPSPYYGYYKQFFSENRPLNHAVARRFMHQIKVTDDAEIRTTLPPHLKKKRVAEIQRNFMLPTLPEPMRSTMKRSFNQIQQLKAKTGQTKQAIHEQSN